jgi:hypothetical protein
MLSLRLKDQSTIYYELICCSVRWIHTFFLRSFCRLQKVRATPSDLGLLFLYELFYHSYLSKVLNNQLFPSLLPYCPLRSGAICNFPNVANLRREICPTGISPRCPICSRYTPTITSCWKTATSLKSLVVLSFYSKAKKPSNLVLVSASTSSFRNTAFRLPF